MKTRALLLLLTLVSATLTPRAGAEEFDSDVSIGITAGRSVDAALKRAQKDDKRVLVFAVDSSKSSQSFHIKGMLEFEDTKKLVREKFILVVTHFKDKNIREFVSGESTERPFYILFNKDGTVAQKGTTAMGGNAGSKLVKEWAAKK